ncbi:MAG: ComEC/Rec2 family competence protein [Alphaproteobacteria bacterium]
MLFPRFLKPFPTLEVQLFFKKWLFWRSFLALWEGEEDRWILWFPVVLGLGIFTYFSLNEEPPVILACVGLALGIGTLILGWSVSLGWRRATVGLFAFTLGFGLSQLQTFCKNPTMLNRHLGEVTLEGTIQSLEHLQPTSQGLVYRIVLGNLDIQQARSASAAKAAKTMTQIRVVIKKTPFPLWVGQRLRLKALISPFRRGVSPYAYEFRMQAFFKGLSATGFATVPPKLVSPPEDTWRIRLDNSRHTLTRLFLEQMPSPTGALAAALVTGDKASVPPEVSQAFAGSGIAHILAISGLHLSIVAGIFFLLVHTTLGLIPSIALRFPLHKLAACFSLVGTGIYLILSGASYPAQRSFMMTGMVMLAVLLDRPALTMRLVTTAATVVLFITPEALFSPSFQLSFAAVVSLIASYEMLGKKIQDFKGSEAGRFRRFIFYCLGCCISTMAADFATTPYTMSTFHQFTLQGIVTNFLCIPLTTFVLMPLAVSTCFLTLVQDVPLTLPFLSKGLWLLAWIAKEISSWPGALVQVPLMPPLAIILMTLGNLWLSLWRTHLRWFGFVLIVWGSFLFYRYPLPNLWVDAEGKLMAFWDDPKKTLWVSDQPKKAFILEAWKQEIGEKVPSPQMFPYHSSIFPWKCDGEACQLTYTLGKKTWKLLLAKRINSLKSCQDMDLAVSLAPFGKPCPGNSLNIHSLDLKRNGSYMVWLTEDGIRIKHGRDIQGNRPWVISEKRKLF